MKNQLNPLPMDKILLCWSLKHPVKVRKVLEINLKPERLLFPVHSIREFLPIMNHYHGS